MFRQQFVLLIFEPFYLVINSIEFFVPKITVLIFLMEEKSVAGQSGQRVGNISRDLVDI